MLLWTPLQNHATPCLAQTPEVKAKSFKAIDIVFVPFLRCIDLGLARNIDLRGLKSKIYWEKIEYSGTYI